MKHHLPLPPPGDLPDQRPIRRDLLRFLLCTPIVGLFLGLVLPFFLVVVAVMKLYRVIKRVKICEIKEEELDLGYTLLVQLLHLPLL